MEQPHQQIAVRLRRLREAFGFESARDFAAFLDVNEQTWYHFERGRRAPTIPDAIRIVAKTGGSLDWIYRNLDHTLPLHLVQKLAAVPEEAVLSDRRQRKSPAGEELGLMVQWFTRDETP